jgi:hypothetical protein
MYINISDSVFNEGGGQNEKVKETGNVYFTNLFHKKLEEC